MHVIDKIFIIILVSLLPKFSFEGNKDYYYKRTKNIFCSDLENGCNFKISSNNPISPKIPTEIPVNAILGSYRYIYLIFHIPQNQIQKFYLMAYDTSSKETIISNGDYYEIDCNENNKYEIRIFKSLKIDSFVQFLFLGITKNIVIEVEIKFKLSIFLYTYDIRLSNDNSLESSNNELILKYIDEINKKNIDKMETLNQVKEVIEIITKKMFDTTINLNNDELLYSEVFFYPPCFIVTLSYKVGLEISTENFFEPENNKLSETKVLKGKIDIHSDGLDLLGGKINIDNTIIKYFDLYNKKTKEVIFDFGLETETYSVTISTNALFDCLIYTFRFFNNDKFENIVYEIEIKIEINNIMLAEIAKNPQTVYSIDLSSLERNKEIIVKGVIFALIIIAVALSTGGLVVLPI